MADACATSVASNLVSKLGEYLFAPIGRQFGYVLCYKSYVEDLKKGVKDLKNARERLQCSIDKALYDGKSIYTDVTDWLESVKKEVEEAESLLRDGESAKIACFRGWLPNPVSRHPIGRKVKKMTPVIQELHKKSNFTEVHYENPPIGLVTATTSAATTADSNEVVLESRASIAEKVIKAIVDDKVSVVGVHGPGGVGKSKLLVDIKRRVSEEKLFDWVLIANVSRNPDIRRIQGEIAYALGLDIMNEETARGRADRLCRRLKSDSKKNILIILDNLWKKLELNEVGIPCGYDNKVRGCKLLISSRNREVLRSDMGSDREFRLDELVDGEARRIFERIVGDRVNDHDIKPWVDGAIKNCGGLPLLIDSLAKRLKNGDLAAWRFASTHRDMSDEKLIVELNYNDLEDDRIRSLFSVCALDSRSIPVRCILAYCMGLGLYKKFSKTIEVARARLDMDLRSLQDFSLLLDSDDREKFRMHDVFADVAISIPSTQWNILVGRKDYGFEEWSKDDELRKCTMMSNIFVGIDKLPEKLDCPNLRMLILAESNPSLIIPESFFESTKKLQVLDFTCLSFTSLPSSIEFLENLKSLCLDFCDLEDVTILGKLKGLQFLSFHGSAIARLPTELGGLTELRFLDLTGCSRLEVIEPGVLGSLVHLEELHMGNSFDQWEAEDEVTRSNASLAELKNMKNLSTLSIAIPHPVDLWDLPFGKLNKHQIQIGEVWDWMGEHKESRTLKLKLDSGNLLLEDWVRKCLLKTQDLHLDGLQHGFDSIHNLCVKGFQELKHFHVQNSPSFQYVVHSTENIQCTTFTRLESVFLKNLQNLKKICHGCLALESFCNLKIVKVDNCGEIKHLFPLSMMRNLLQLKEIEISRCHLMQQIFANAEFEDRDEIDDDTQMKSCNLRRLTLQKLPEMTSFCTTANHSVDFFDRQQLIQLQGLESITIERCKLIKEVFDLEGLIAIGEVEILTQLRELILRDLPSLGRIWNKNPRRTLCFRNLRALKVQNCEKLRFLFSTSMAKALGQVKEIEIGSCKLMEAIIDVQEEELEEGATANTLEFPLLTSLSLEELPNLTTFSYGKYRIHCASLTRLTISRCPKMMTISSFDGRQQSIKGNTSLRQAFGRFNSGLSLPGFINEKIEFPSMESMKISHMDNVEKIWLDELASNAFRKLKTLTVEYCEKLSSIFSSYTILKKFKNLEKLTVTDCGSLKVIFHVQDYNFSECHSTSTFQLRELVLTRLPKIEHVWNGLPKGGLTFGHLQCVKAVECKSLKSLFPTSVAKSMTQLEVLLVRSCGVEQIIAEEDEVGTSASDHFFSQLTDLRLLELPELRSFYRNSHTSTWPFLKQLRVRHCGKMRSFSFACDIQSCQGTTTYEDPPALFSFIKVIPHLEILTLTEEDVAKTPLHYIFRNLRRLALACYHDDNVAFPSDFLLQRFPNLEELDVMCSSFEEIFPEDASRNGGATPCGGLTYLQKPLNALGNLKRLELRKLCNLRRVWKDGSLMVEILKQIEVLWVMECLSLSIVFPSPTSFQRLTHLGVKDCVGLVHMGTCSAMTSLVHLTRLILRNCGAMEDVVTDDGNGVEEISFPKLRSLMLDCLPSLESFSPANRTFRFPSLERVVVTQCPKMNIFCKGALRTPILDKVLLSSKDVEGRWEGDLNTTIQNLST